ncbi:dihydroflavonol-4-reductase [Actinoplanes italicus]|uniref:Nucleoside-diphosphate-sugar epimerase n=1 Tax=Actinoplanes italicus TaxID=113567 RepID=A0A2T0K5Q7_9ACTN|nr:aldehyde reductase [Actinoplanes italicus]PRX18295.1 nucleoside-diphosphate-sugar epimerase [Actinoplanes italicus]GIE32702.1 dihydroflavonol-4-reductase [Actinoplanes italicus]
MTQKLVLVTGGSGFIAGHVILQLLGQGYRVRTTVRSLQREAAVRAVLTEAGMSGGDSLSFVAADLLGDAGWADAVAGCDYVMHVASPVHPGKVANEDDVIVPAREGTVRVLRAARDAGVKRVVLTSAFHAVSWGHPHREHAFTEEDWTILDGPGVDAYGRSKTLAERDAWDFVAAEGRGMELVALCPVAVVGPLMGREVSGTNHLVQRVLDGGMPGYPNLFIPFVDVRDVASAHVLAMTAPGAAGQRFLLADGPAIAMRQVGELLRANLGDAAGRVPTRKIPDFVVRVGALFNPELRSLVPDLGYVKKPSNAKARRVLGWQPRPAADAIVAAAESMIRTPLR